MILMYHKVALNSPSIWWVNANEFYRQMLELSGKEVVYLDDYDINNPNHAVITFDGVYKNVYDYALPILKYFNYPFELFISSDYIGKDNTFDAAEEPLSKFTTQEELEELIKYKGRLQWHTKSHPNLKQEKESRIIEDELIVPEELLKIDLNGFNWFAYPHGEYNEMVLKEVKKRFNGAVSCHQGKNKSSYELDRITVTNNTKLIERSIACIVASYNYGDYLIEAVESVLSQTIVPDEILITDDCSSDDTRSISEAYVKKYPKLIKYNRNEVNLGIVDNFNKAINLTNSDYVFFLGADNRIVSNYVEECARILDSSKQIGIAYTDYALFGPRAKVAFDRFSTDRKGPVKLNTYYQVIFPEFSTYKDLHDEILKGNFIQGSSMYRRKAFDSVGGYLKSSTAEDFNLFRRITVAGWDAKKARNTNLEYRQHSHLQANYSVGLYEKAQFYRKLYEEKSIFEKTKVYSLAFKFYRLKRFFVHNYKSPKKIIYKIRKKLTKVLFKK